MSHPTPPSEAELHVLAALATQPDGACSTSALRDATTIPDKTLLAALSSLVERGWITHESRPDSLLGDQWRITLRPPGELPAAPPAQKPHAPGNPLWGSFPRHPGRYFLLLLLLAGLAGLVQFHTLSLSTTPSNRAPARFSTGASSGTAITGVRLVLQRDFLPPEIL